MGQGALLFLLSGRSWTFTRPSIYGESVRTPRDGLASSELIALAAFVLRE